MEKIKSNYLLIVISILSISFGVLLVIGNTQLKIISIVGLIILGIISFLVLKKYNLSCPKCNSNSILSETKKESIENSRTIFKKLNALSVRGEYYNERKYTTTHKCEKCGHIWETNGIVLERKNN